VNHTTGASVPFYPIPDEAITQPHWIEGGEPGNVDLRASADRHMLIFERDHRYLYELYNVYFDGTRWNAGSGAFFDVNTNGRRPDGWMTANDFEVVQLGYRPAPESLTAPTNLRIIR